MQFEFEVHTTTIDPAMIEEVLELIHDLTLDEEDYVDAYTIG